MNPNLDVVIILTCVIWSVSSNSLPTIKTHLFGSNLEMSCNSNETPMWMRKGIHQQDLHGIAYGDKPKARFENTRLVN